MQKIITPFRMADIEKGQPMAPSLDAAELFGGKESIAAKIVEMIREQPENSELLDGKIGNPSDPCEILSKISKSELLRFFFVNDMGMSDAFGTLNWNGTQETWQKALIGTSSQNLIAVDGSPAPPGLALRLFVQDVALNQLCMPAVPLAADERTRIEGLRARFRELTAPKSLS